MAWIAKRLPYNAWALVDYENPEQSPQVTVNGSIQANPELTNNFGRILNGQVRDTEEVRKDFACIDCDGYEYVAYGPAGANVNDTVWLCVRRTWENKVVIRTQYRENIAWSNRAEGWI